MAEQVSRSLIMSSDVVYDQACDICAEDDKNFEAFGYCTNCGDYLCQECFIAHPRSRPSRNHVLLDKGNMPRQKPLQIVPTTTATITEKCPRHTNKPIEYHCRYHRELGCSTCMIKSHRTCQNLDNIPDNMDSLLESQQYRQFTQNLSTLTARSKDVITTSKENISISETLCNDAAKAVQVLRKKMRDGFDNLERSTTSESETIKTADFKKMKAVAAKGSKVVDEVENLSAELQSLQKKNQPGQLFIQIIKHQDTVASLHDLLSKAEADNHVTMYTFKPRPGLSTSLGELYVRPTAPAAPSTANDYVDQKAVLVREFPVQTKYDCENCWITGTTLLPDSKLVVADRGNNKVKLLDLQSNKVMSELHASAPRDVTTISTDQIAVIFLKKKKIAIVKATDKLRMDREISVEGRCKGIQYNKGKMIVAFDQPTKIEIMALDGRVQKRIEQPDLCEWPLYVKLSPGRGVIYKSDRRHHCVKRMILYLYGETEFDDDSDNEEAVYTDEKLQRPERIVVDPHGRVLVCDSGKIHLLSPDLSKGKVLIDGLDSFTSLSLCSKTDTLFVGYSCHNSDIKVYQLS